MDVLRRVTVFENHPLRFSDARFAGDGPFAQGALTALCACVGAIPFDTVSRGPFLGALWGVGVDGGRQAGGWQEGPLGLPLALGPAPAPAPWPSTDIRIPPGASVLEVTGDR